MTRPVCPLKLALYGHPDAGSHWEAHCESHLSSVGFERIPDWHSTFWHPQLKLLLIVYVDDFKLSGPKCNLEKAWKLIQKGVTLETPTPLGLYLGCRHIQGSYKLPDGTKVRTVTYDMESFLASCVELYQSLAPPSFKLKYVPTPFPPEGVKDDGPAGNPAVIDGKVVHCPWCQESFPDQLNKPIPKRPAKAKPSALLEGTAGDKMKEGEDTSNLTQQKC